MKLKKYGFFKELRHGDENGISLKVLINKNASTNEDKFVKYLKKGVVFIACPGIVKDVLDEKGGIIGSPHILTDGVWAWPADLIYYIEKYHIKIPNDFEKHMMDNSWIPPIEGNINFEELEL